MNTTKLEKKTHQIIDEYILDLDRYTLEQLQMKPSEDSWSLGQVYVHLWMSANGFFFKKAQACLTKEGAEQGKGKNWKGHLVFALGRMPDIKVRMPKQIAVEPRQPESKEQIISKLNEIKQQSSAYISQIKSSDQSFRMRHPIFSYLSMAEWISLCNMHFRHHEAQKKRIKQHFGWK